jgi:hypothetical protein
LCLNMGVMNRSGGPVNSRSAHIWTALFLFASALFLYFLLFEFPFKPYTVTDIGDSMLYLAPGLRMYQGEIPYRDFFEFITPGMGLVHYFLFKLVGVRYWIPNLLAMSVSLGMLSLGIAIARKVIQPKLAILPSAALVVGCNGYLCDPVHHWYSMLAGLAAIFVLLERRTLQRVALAGIFCGVSASFTQTRGLAAFVGVAVYLVWEAWTHHQGPKVALKRFGILFVCALSAFLVINGYFIWKAGPERYFWCTVVFVLKYYPKEADWNTFQSLYSTIPTIALTRRAVFSILHWTFLFLLGPFSYVAFFAYYWRNRRSFSPEQWTKPMIIAVVGLFIFLCVAPSPNENRMSVSCLPPLVLLVWLIERTTRVRRLVLTVIVALIALSAIHQLIRRQPKNSGVISTSYGILIVQEKIDYDEYSWVLDHTHFGDYMYEAEFSDMYFYLGVRNPTLLPRAVNNGYTTEDQVKEAIGQLEQHKPRFIIWGASDPPVVPAWEDPKDAHLPLMLDYIHTHYRQVKAFRNKETAWERITQ